MRNRQTLISRWIKGSISRERLVRDGECLESIAVSCFLPLSVLAALLLLAGLAVLATLAVLAGLAVMAALAVISFEVLAHAPSVPYQNN